jgi:hypothetical protein
VRRIASLTSELRQPNEAIVPTTLRLNPTPRAARMASLNTSRSEPGEGYKMHGDGELTEGKMWTTRYVLSSLPARPG